MKKISVVLVLGLFLTIVGIIWWENGLRAVNPLSTNPVIFLVKKGENVREIANNLKAHGLIRDPIVFFLLIKRNGFDKQIQAGDFRLVPNMTTEQVAEALTHGILDIWVTIPEGLRAEEIADILKTKMPSFNESWRKVLDQNEGYLFPDTYLFPKDATAENIVSIMTTNFKKRYDGITSPKTNNLSQDKIVILASIIEKEAMFAEDRALVASVLMNRINIGMALGSDPTVQYALGYQANTHEWWKKDLTVDDLAINSPYNTRKNAGIPPTPISNPGLSAIEAALNPTDTNYLYFYSDKNGHLHFAATLEGHQANIKKYEN